jgi:hypothetical protein
MQVGLLSFGGRLESIMELHRDRRDPRVTPVLSPFFFLVATVKSVQGKNKTIFNAMFHDSSII